MKRAFEAHVHGVTRHVTSKWLVVLAALVLGLGAVALQPPVAPAQQSDGDPVLLGTTESFAVLGGTTVTNTGSSVISGDVGVAPGLAVTGFPPGTVNNGTIRRGDEVAAQAQADLTTAYDDAAGRTPTEEVDTELGGQTLTTGVYDSASGTFGITGDLTLDGEGDPDAVFIFQTESTLITASASQVVFINGAQACNVFWQVGSSATLGTSSSFAGNILALTSITATTGATVDGRLLARNGAVTLDSNTIAQSECATDGDGDTPGEGDTPGDGTGDGDTPGEGDTPGDGTGDGDTPGDGTGGGSVGSDGDRNTQNDQSGQSAREGTLPFTGLGIGIPALVGTVMLLLGAGLRTKMSARKT
jgi:hypothetical protein